MSTSVYLVRHGRTALNAQGRFRGRQDVPLDDHGFVDAAGAARALADVKLVAVYTSPLLRTRQTAEFVAGPSSARVVEEPDLIDLDHGRWEALTAEEAAALDPAAFDRFRNDPRDAEPPGGERMAEVERRVLEALARIGRRHDGSALAAVSHEIPIRLVIANLAAIDGPSFWAFALPTGAVTELRFERDRLELVGEAPARAEG